MCLRLQEAPVNHNTSNNNNKPPSKPPTGQKPQIAPKPGFAWTRGVFRSWSRQRSGATAACRGTKMRDLLHFSSSPSCSLPRRIHTYRGGALSSDPSRWYMRWGENAVPCSRRCLLLSIVFLCTPTTQRRFLFHALDESVVAVADSSVILPR